MSRRLVLSAICLILVGVMPTSAFSRERSELPLPPLTEMVRFRSAMGLNSTEPHVRSVADRYAWDPAVDDNYGVPLLPDEAAEVARRVRIQEGLGPLRALLAVDESTYGGHYIDQQAGGTVVVQLVGSAGPSDDVLRDVLPEGAELRVESVRHSAAELRTLTDAVTADWEMLRELGVDVVSTAFSGRDNLVQIGVAEPTADEIALLESRYGSDKVEVLPEGIVPANHGCISTDHCAYPMRGGVWISGCTAGFVMRRGSNTFLLTAGHCSASSTGGIFVHNGYGSIGGTYASAAFDGSRADAKIIDMTDSQESNRVFLTTTSYRLITSWQGVYDDNVGDLVCKMGANTGYATCGNISSVYVSTNVAGVDYIGQRRADFSAVGGDSGGPVYSAGGGTNRMAIGVFSALSTSYRYYSHIGYVYQMLNVTPCFDSQCGDGGV